MLRKGFAGNFHFISFSYIEQQQLVVLFTGSLLLRDCSMLIHKEENPSLGSQHAHERHANAIWGLAHQLIDSNLSERFETLLSKGRWRLTVRTILCQPLTSTRAYVEVFILHDRQEGLYQAWIMSHTPVDVQTKLFPFIFSHYIPQLLPHAIKKAPHSAQQKW